VIISAPALEPFFSGYGRLVILQDNSPVVKTRCDIEVSLESGGQLISKMEVKPRSQQELREYLAFTSEGNKIRRRVEPVRVAFKGHNSIGDSLVSTNGRWYGETIQAQGNDVQIALRAHLRSCEIARRDIVPALKSDVVIYYLTNCLLFYLGLENPEDLNTVRGASDPLAWELDDLSLTIHRLSTYCQFDSHSAENPSGVSAALVIRSSSSVFEDLEMFDALAQDVCDLLTFATNNTVAFAIREYYPAVTGRPVVRYYSRRLLQFEGGKRIIPGGPIEGAERDLHRLHLRYFLQRALPKYRGTFRKSLLRDCIQLLVESYRSAQPTTEYTLVFIALERLRTLLRDSGSVVNRLAPNWDEMVKGDLGTSVIGTIEDAIGVISNRSKERIRRKLREANRLDQSAVLSQLANRYGVRGLRRSHTKLRNKIFHEGGSFPYQDDHVRSHSRILRHVIQCIILKELDYDGYCCTEAAHWFVFDIRKGLRIRFSDDK